MLYYKFFKYNQCALEKWIDGKILFSKISDLNDISETFIRVDEDDVRNTLLKRQQIKKTNEEIELERKESVLLERIQLVGEDSLQNDVKNAASPYPCSTIDDLKKMPMDKWQAMAKVMNDKIQDRVVIFCASKTYKSFPMWAHYAENANGLVIEFKNLEKLFSDEETGILDKLRPIEYYRGRRPPIKIGPSNQLEMLFSKHSDWKYEREYRVVKPLNDCYSEKCPDGKTRFYDKIDPQKYIKRIIVGWKCPKDKLKEIEDFVKSRSSIPVVQADVKNAEIIIP